MASRTRGTTTTLIVSPRGQITLPKPVRARLRLGPGSVLLLRVEAGKIVLDPAAVTPVSLYADEEMERLVGADRANPNERAALPPPLGLEAGRAAPSRSWLSSVSSLTPTFSSPPHIVLTASQRC